MSEREWTWDGKHTLSKAAARVHDYIVKAYTTYLDEEEFQEHYVGQSNAQEIALMRDALVRSGLWRDEGENELGHYILVYNGARNARLRFEKVGRTKERYYFEPNNEN